MLLEPERHVPLKGEPWNAAAVAAEVRNIVDRLASDFIEGEFWSVPTSDDRKEPTTTVYLGAMGILWTLVHLQSYASKPLPFHVRDVAETAYDRYFTSEGKVFAGRGPEDSVGSWWLGETGVLGVLGKLVPERAEECWQRTYALARANVQNPTLEPLWGGTGTIMPALFRLEARSSEEEWRDLLVTQCEFMRQSTFRHKSPDCVLWEQDLYGHKMRYLGAGHGFAGNMYPFLRGAAWLPDDMVRWARDTTIETLSRTALVEDDCANWRPDPRSETLTVQWCHGAPGIIVAADWVPRGYSNDFDALLVKAGELIWRAGPLTKGAALCHGTDGNGFALLKLYKRTGEAKWLDRARSFAMHVVDERAKAYSLWEGEAGRACFLHACITGDDGFPMLDVC